MSSPGKSRAISSLAHSPDVIEAVLNAVQSTMWVFVLDEDGTILDCSDGALEQYQRTRGELVGKPFRDLSGSIVPESTGDASPGVISGEACRYRSQHTRGDGATFPVIVSMTPLEAKGGRRVACVIAEPVSQPGETRLPVDERDLFEALLENIPDAVYFKDRDSRFICISRYHLGKFGLKHRSEVVGKTDFDFFAEAHAQQAYDDEQRVMATGEPLVNAEEVETWVDRPDTWVSTSKVPLRDRDGNIVGILGISRDITARKRAEQELERSNAELQHFAYVASHDLQEPLRMITSYVQLLARRYQGKLDGDADEFISYAVDGANRMKALINDLLTYSRVSTHSKPMERISSEAALRRALSNLQLAIEDAGATITHDPLPEVMGDDVQLVEVFQNLVGNAIKFRRDDEPPRVHVWARSGNGEWIFSVSDNGIGFETQYLDRIFGIFQRLHHRSDYPGTGMGLAICRRIVERHHGRIWAESEPGVGSIFHFTLGAAGG